MTATNLIAYLQKFPTMRVRFALNGPGNAHETLVFIGVDAGTVVLVREDYDDTLTCENLIRHLEAAKMDELSFGIFGEYERTIEFDECGLNGSRYEIVLKEEL